ncbi:hypothetical protein HZY83_07400 [Gemella sp. GH3]|uniref:hypothetical protein n=1 Tax=unclassified Gemella TaxID=2624949 RepID=UPI0015CFB5FD|nr:MULTISPECIES: hypothetical protein [unclassified Gemella]MBF0714499.1 hypothetical protein [Gemella sp. GH3.1]NYS51451.1 hypothetical protein [Gemella sp. GH3]
MKNSTIQFHKEILHNLDFEAISVTVDKSTTGTEIINGKKVLKAGTLISGDGASIFDDRTKKVKKLTNEATAEYVDGVLLYDVDLSDGDGVGTCVYKGTLREDKVNGGSVDNNAKLKLSHIKFVKGV